MTNDELMMKVDQRIAWLKRATCFGLGQLIVASSFEFRHSCQGRFAMEPAACSDKWEGFSC